MHEKRATRWLKNNNPHLFESFSNEISAGILPVQYSRREIGRHLTLAIHHMGEHGATGSGVMETKVMGLEFESPGFRVHSPLLGLF